MGTPAKTFDELVNDLYERAGGRDIDAAIERDRKLLELHDRELEHVATLPFDQHYRWRVAPSLMLRAQKDLERQMLRRVELLDACRNQIRAEQSAPEVNVKQAEAMMRQAASLEAMLDGVVKQLAEAGIDLGEEIEAEARAA